jgi:hypothetical protein
VTLPDDHDRNLGDRGGEYADKAKAEANRPAGQARPAPARGEKQRVPQVTNERIDPTDEAHEKAKVGQARFPRDGDEARARPRRVGVPTSRSGEHPPIPQPAPNEGAPD